MLPQPLTLQAKALQLLAARDYSRAEMERKLRHWLQQRAVTAAGRPAALAGLITGDTLLARQTGATHLAQPQPDVPPLPSHAACSEAAPDDTHIPALLDALERKGYLNDQRAAQALVHRRANKLGAGRIRQELRQKGLDDDTIAQAVHELPQSETSRAREVWQKKFGTQATTPAERARQMRFLASRGFGSDTVRAVLTDPFGDDAHSV